jgi:DNA-binding NarL/FixJ family response regulator
MNANLNILIADDHDLVREGLKHTLGGLPNTTSFIEAGSADEVRQALVDLPPVSLVILDLHMPGANGLELLTTICNEYPDIPVVILSAVEEPQVMQRTIDRGAAGFIPKSAANEVLVSALQLVLAGGVYIPNEILNRKNVDTESAYGTAGNMLESPKLTDRQMDVLHLLSNGESNKVIARKLGISEHTIKIHISAIFKALGVNNRTAAAIAYRDMGSQT